MAFQFPSDVPGWLSEREGRALHRLARGRRVLEIGSYCGRSTACMIQSAAKVDCVDPFDSRATGEAGATFERFAATVKSFGGAEKVTAHVGTSAEVLPDLPAASYDLVFIDGDHSPEAVALDVEHAERLLAPGGILAFHDYRAGAAPGQRNDPGVNAAVNRLLRNGRRLKELADTLAVLEERPASGSGEQSVFLAIPARPGGASAAGEHSIVRPTERGSIRVNVSRTSACCWSFNRHWCDAVNARDAGEPLTHFAMQHDDVFPVPLWCDRLIDVMGETRADLVSAVLPIKDGRGLTTTAIRSNLSGQLRRLTMREVDRLPEHFTVEDVTAAGISTDAGHDVLLVNTGLWVARLDMPWVDRFPGFKFLDGIQRDPNTGQWVATILSEDWLASVWWASAGVRVVATKSVFAVHRGYDPATGIPRDYPNVGAWGEWDTDRGGV